jgi:hypothetical protein
MQDTEVQSARRILTTFDEVKAGVVSIADTAKRSITILTRDLEPGIYDSDDFLEALKRFALGKRFSRLRVLISDPARTTRNGNKLIALGRRLEAHIDFRNLHQDYRGQLRGAFIIADETAVMYRVDGKRYDGIMGSHEPVIAQQHLQEFEQPWEASAYKHTMPVIEI